MRFWPSVILGGVVCGIVGALAIAAAWNHAGAQVKKEPPAATQGAPVLAPPQVNPGKSSSPRPGPTMNAPGGMNFNNSTVNNPTINNPPQSPEISSKLDRIIRSLDDRANQEKLRAKYPSGYVIFGSDHANAILPNAKTHFRVHY